MTDIPAQRCSPVNQPGIQPSPARTPGHANHQHANHQLASRLTQLARVVDTLDWHVRPPTNLSWYADPAVLRWFLAEAPEVEQLAVVTALQDLYTIGWAWTRHNEHRWVCSTQLNLPGGTLLSYEDGPASYGLAVDWVAMDPVPVVLEVHVDGHVARAFHATHTPAWDARR